MTKVCADCGSQRRKELFGGMVNICDNCVTVKRFFGARKYFESVECLEDFEEYYSSMPLYKKTMENKYLLYSLFASSIIFYLAYVY